MTGTSQHCLFPEEEHARACLPTQYHCSQTSVIPAVVWRFKCVTADQLNHRVRGLHNILFIKTKNTTIYCVCITCFRPVYSTHSQVPFKESQLLMFDCAFQCVRNVCIVLLQANVYDGILIRKGWLERKETLLAYLNSQLMFIDIMASLLHRT